MDRAAKEQELARLRATVQRLEGELSRDEADQAWPPRGYYTAYHVLAGTVLGMIGASTSLLFNVIGSALVEQHPLQLIRVYLTFPLGETALQVNNGLTLTIGCCLYLGTGMLLGVPFQIVLTRWCASASFQKRLVVTSVLALALWLFNYYAVLSWLQPLLFGGRWIVELIPAWVAALTHLVFGWTMLLVQPLGTFVPYRPTAET
jgi:hypothetical protein